MFQFLAEAREFSLFQSIQGGCEACPTSCLMSAWGRVAKVWSWPLSF